MKNNFTFLIAFIVFLSLAGFAFAITLTNPLSGSGVNSFPELIKAITKFITGIIASLAIIMFVWAGILFVTSGGNEGRLSTAKKALMYAVIGTAIALAGEGLILVITAVIGPPP